MAAVLFFPGEYGGVEGSGWWGLGVGGLCFEKVGFSGLFARRLVARSYPSSCCHTKALVICICNYNKQD